MSGAQHPSVQKRDARKIIILKLTFFNTQEQSAEHTNDRLRTLVTIRRAFGSSWGVRHTRAGAQLFIEDVTQGSGRVLSRRHVLILGRNTVLPLRDCTIDNSRSALLGPKVSEAAHYTVQISVIGGSESAEPGKK